MSWLSILSSVAGGMAGDALSAEDRAAARKLMERMVEEYRAIPEAGFTDEKAEQLGPSALEGIEDDPRLREDEMGALDGLREMEDMGGLTLTDQAALNKIQNKTARQESAGRAAIANDFAARGQLGSNAQLAMSLQNQQDSANRSAEAGMDTAAAAQRRYFDAKLQRGKLAGDISDRDYRKKADAARARDDIARSNAAARTDAGRYNNTGRQQQFGNRVTLANGRSGVAGKQVNYLQGQADRTSERYARLGEAGAKYFADDEDQDE